MCILVGFIAAMGTEAPEIGRWYRSPSRPLFEVVAVSADDGTIELQYFDGTIEEIDPDDWISMRTEATGAPEDWSGSVDISNEDLPDNRLFAHLDWQSEVDALDIEDLLDTELPDSDSGGELNL